jgi:hypothetical protein
LRPAYSVSVSLLVAIFVSTCRGVGSSTEMRAEGTPRRKIRRLGSPSPDLRRRDDRGFAIADNVRAA